MALPLQPLHGLLEETAANFEDCSIGLPIDARYILWIATANSETLLDDALRSRFAVFRLVAPQGEDARIVTNNLAKELISERCANDSGSPYNFHEDVLNELTQFSIRRQKEIIEDTLTDFMLQYKAGTIDRQHLINKRDEVLVAELPKGKSTLITQESFKLCRNALDNMKTGQHREMCGKRLDKIISAGFHRQHDFVEEAQQSLLDLKKICPHFSEVIDYVFSTVVIGAKLGKALRIDPLLLVGDPGLGKTDFVVKLAKALNVCMKKISMEGLMDLSPLLGNSYNCTSGVIFDALYNSPDMHPIILVDELDKAGREVTNALLGVTEVVTARTFKDESLPLCMDASLVIWIATANSKDSIEMPVLSRFREFNITMPHGEDAIALAAHIFSQIKIEMDIGPEYKVAEDALATVANYVPRVQKKMLNDALRRILMKNRTTLLLSDLSLPKSKGRIGF